MASPKLVEPDRDEGAVHLETTSRVSEESGGRVCFSAAGWFRHSRSLALTSWLNQHPGNKPRWTASASLDINRPQFLKSRSFGN